MLMEGAAMGKFKIPENPPTVNKTIRFPSDVVEGVEAAIKGKDCNFSAFVIAAVRAALEDLEQWISSEKPDKFGKCKKNRFFYLWAWLFEKIGYNTTVRFIEDLCNGSTPDSDSVCGGSNPSSSAKKAPTTFVAGAFLHGEDSNRSEC